MIGLETKALLLRTGGFVALGATAVATILLAVALFLKAREPRPVVLVPGLDRPRVVDPGRVPDALARDFAVDFAISFENYSPATIEKVSKFLRSRVAPDLFSQFSQVLEKRAKLVSETGMVSQLLPNDPGDAIVRREGERIEVTFTATRRVYVGDRLSQEGRLAYRLVLVSGQPTRDNPTGLFVLGQSARGESATKEVGNGNRK